MDRRLLAAVSVNLLCLSSAHAESKHPAPTVPWAITQLVPSPGAAWDSNGHGLSLRWQLTPFLYSWGVHRNAPLKVRFFVVEPSYRNTGSFETFVSPEWLRDGHRFALRAGLRTYLPVAQRGEALSLSLGSGIWQQGREVGPMLEAGAYVLFGVLGGQLSYAPGLAHAEWTATLVWRVL